MKPSRSVLLIMVMLGLSLTLSAQDDSGKPFSHLSVGVNLGTGGLGIDIGTPIASWLQLRAGYDFFSVKDMNIDLDVMSASSNQSVTGLPKEIETASTISMSNAKLLLDFFPLRNSTFHFSVGVYAGKSKVLEVENKEGGALMAITQYNKTVSESQRAGLSLGDYLLTPDANGNINAYIETNSVKPYIGLGFGRSVPRKRVGFMFDVGCAFWNSPKLICNGQQINENDVSGDSGGIMKTFSKISIYPMVSFRLCGRIF